MVVVEGVEIADKAVDHTLWTPTHNHLAMKIAGMRFYVLEMRRWVVGGVLVGCLQRARLSPQRGCLDRICLHHSGVLGSDQTSQFIDSFKQNQGSYEPGMNSDAMALERRRHCLDQILHRVDQKGWQDSPD